MSDQEILHKLFEMAVHYDEGWTLYDLQCDLEEIFAEVNKRCGLSNS